jgi:DNA mismatch repair protein MutS
MSAPAAPAFAPSSGLDKAVADLDPDGMSPREAMEALYRLKGMLVGR